MQSNVITLFAVNPLERAARIAPPPQSSPLIRVLHPVVLQTEAPTIQMIIDLLVLSHSSSLEELYAKTNPIPGLTPLEAADVQFGRWSNN